MGAAGTSAAGTTGAAGTSAAGTTGAAGTSAPVPVTVKYDIATNEDDALWLNGDEERLQYAPGDPTIEVGTDSEMGRAGLRFQVSVPRGANIMSAAVTVFPRDGNLTGVSALSIHIYDSVSVPPFNRFHTHTPAEHDERGLVSNGVDGFLVLDDMFARTTPNLAALVQRVVDKSEWPGSGAIGFVLSPQRNAFEPGEWVAFDDYSSGSGGASLAITYVQP
jgi:hypothetical protein